MKRIAMRRLWPELPRGATFNLKSEIEIANLRQSLGHKRIEKISPDRFGHGFDFFDPFLLQHLATSWPF
jgi:hypothetical protein